MSVKAFDILTLKVTLTEFARRVRGMPYRLLQVPATLTLFDLAQEITSSFKFDFDHCFGFYDSLKDYHDSREAYEVFSDLYNDHDPLRSGIKAKGVKKIETLTAFPQVGKKMLFLFDYGDQWLFLVELVSIVEPKRAKKYPCIIKRVGRSPQQYSLDRLF